MFDDVVMMDDMVLKEGQKLGREHAMKKERERMMKTRFVFRVFFFLFFAIPRKLICADERYQMHRRRFEYHGRGSV